MSPITEKFRLPMHKANTNAIKLKVEYGKCRLKNFQIWSRKWSGRQVEIAR